MKSIAKSCFVISPIGEEGSNVRRRANKILRYIIKPVCDNLGYTANRADEISHVSLISRRVMAEVLTADLVIADLTGHNPNVYYELAARHFIGKPVVQLIESSERLPFDVSDLNTIKVDHTDLDSVDEAKKKLAEFITAADAADTCHNPVSVVLESLDISVEQKGRPGKTLADTFEEISRRMIEELRDSRRDRKLLWDKLFERQNQPAESSSRAGRLLDLSGVWNGNYGSAKLIQVGNTITGKYEYMLSGWVGELIGEWVGERVVFRWHWVDSSQLFGIGYWDFQEDRLSGKWYYHYEADYTIQQLVEQPEVFDGDNVEVATFEGREWSLNRISS